MVYHGKPQGPGSQSLLVNTNNPPQGHSGSGAGPFLLVNFPPLADNTYQFYGFYQVKKNQTPSTQTNKPLVIIDTLDPGTLQQASGFDIRAFDSAGAPLDYYVQFVNIVTREIIVWVNVDIVQDGEFIQLTFGKSDATDGSNPFNVWSNNDFVYPLDETNSTVTNLVGINSTSTGTTQVNGKIHKAIHFDNNTQFVELVSSDWTSENNQSTFSISFWYKSTDAGRGIFLGNFNGVNPMNFNIELSTSRLRIFADDGPDITDLISPTDATITDGQSHHVVCTYDGSTRIFKIYFDGSLVATSLVRPDNAAIFFEPANTFFLSRDSRITFNYVGDLEFLEKINNIALSADEITTIFNNQNDNDSFWFKTRILEKGKNYFLVDNMERKIKVGVNP